MLKKKFFKLSLYQTHVVAFGLTILKWYNTWVLQIFFVNIFFKNWKKNILKNIFSKILTKNIFNTQVLYRFGIIRPNALIENGFKDFFFW